MRVEELIEMAEPIVTQSAPIGHRPRTGDDTGVIVAIARELAAHNPVPPAGWRWWADAVGWYDDPRTIFLGTLARDAAISSQHLASGHLTRDEASALCTLVTEYRDRVFAPSFAFARREMVAWADTWRAAGPEMARIVDSAVEWIAVLDAASAPLEPLFRERDNGTTVDVASAADVLEPIRVDTGDPRPSPLICGACNKRWTPRVVRPVRCPRCQRPIRWPAEPSTTDA